MRSSPKDHGRENVIEGQVFPGRKVVIIEDLVSTGSSSLKAYNALHEAGYQVLGMVAIFTYGFPEATDNFKKAGCRLETLSSYEVLIEEASRTGYILPEQMEILRRGGKILLSGSPDNTNNMIKLQSRTGTVNSPVNKVYSFLSDFRNFSQFIPSETIDNWQAEADSCSLTLSNLGRAGLRMVEREPNRLIKITGEALTP